MRRRILIVIIMQNGTIASSTDINRYRDIIVIIRDSKSVVMIVLSAIWSMPEKKVYRAFSYHSGTKAVLTYERAFIDTIA